VRVSLPQSAQVAPSCDIVVTPRSVLADCWHPAALDARHQTYGHTRGAESAVYPEGTISRGRTDQLGSATLRAIDSAVRVGLHKMSRR
jgi:hypothetical protein